MGKEGCLSVENIGGIPSQVINATLSNEGEKLFILYDGNNVQSKWREHLLWLDQYLPVKGIKIQESEKWLEEYA